ncbi:hypothetical protein ANCCAN_04893 [Ancylostoma caninum]|uniref:Uncharacterized protein n=1 Tax=Ancylostoma caninum TaxID=29170 RepID=A0A368GXE0_ANCCA|nr:hypothetical protein ANCCAN_04893 [Ancylostoma caninum]
MATLNLTSYLKMESSPWSQTCSICGREGISL